MEKLFHLKGASTRERPFVLSTGSGLIKSASLRPDVENFIDYKLFRARRPRRERDDELL